MFKDKLLARIHDLGIRFYSSMGYSTTRNTEYKFAFSNIPPEKSIILDVGSTGSLFPLQIAKLGHMVHSIDTRPYHENHPNLKVFTGDIIDNLVLKNDYYDIITCISTIEHIGLSAYGDPNHNDGDLKTINKFKDLLKNRGKLIITVPFLGEFKMIEWEDSIERIYDHSTLMNLFNGFDILKEEYYMPIKPKNWIKTTREEAEKENDTYHQSNLSCFLLQINK